MANIYTKTGDKGTTGLYGGSRVDKDSMNVDVYGTIDEAISALGVAYAQTESPDIREYINHIQKRMFQAGAEFASDEKGLEMLKDKIGEADIKYLEDIVDQSTKVNGLMREFVVPGVNPSSAALHVARTVVRRAERKITTLAREIPVRDELRKYINRLSDACFAMARLEEIVAMCEKSGVHTQFVPDYHNIIPTKPYTEDLQGLPVINIRYVPLNNTFLAAIKRGVDIIGALVAIVLFSPVMLFSCLAIKLTSPGPLIYRQTRVGLHNKLFEMYKFRSMEVQPEETEKKAWTVKNDPRVTGYGKFMRHTSIDELPQLFNILKGDMSLVGPRPERPFFVEKFREEIPRYMVKHQVRPGLTGWAQVNGYRGDTSIRKRIDCDLYYIENWTLGLDFKILFLTFFKGFVNKNAY